MPWLNRFDREWLDGIVDDETPIVVVDDHSPIGGLGDALRRELEGRAITVCGVEGWPAFGTPPEALRAHGLDGASLAGRIAEARSLSRA
jgi:transketolase